LVLTHLVLPCATVFPYTTLVRARFPLEAIHRVGLVAARLTQALDQFAQFLVLARGDVARQRDQRGAEVQQLAHALAALVEVAVADRKSTRLNSSHVEKSYAFFCL